MKSFAVALLLTLASIVMASETTTLETAQWNYRILVIPESSNQTLAKLKLNKPGLDERDIFVVIMGSNDPSALQQQIRNRFQIFADGKEILFIGKDGNTTVRWPVGAFTFEGLFQRIDAMPMRQREMRQR